MSKRYEITSLIEKDHLGEVFMAQDVTLQRKVVFRKFSASSDKEEPSSFGEYTGKLCALQHPNLLPIYDIDRNDEGHFMVTQFIDAEILGDRLKLGPLSQTGVYNMASDLLDAFHAVHSMGIFHGSLRSDSVKRLPLARGGHRYLIVDLGLDKITAIIGGRANVLADTVLIAPELLDGKAEVNIGSDLFALGQLCYSALAGGHPMTGNSPEQCAALYCEGEMPNIKEYAPELQQDFADWIMSLIMRDPSQRPESTEAAMATLHAITLDAPVPNVPGVTQAVVQVATVVEPQFAQEITVSAEQQEASMGSKLMALPKKTRMIGAAAAAGLLLLLVILMVSLSGNGAGSEAEVSGSREGPVFMYPPQMIHTKVNVDQPTSVDFDGGGSLDWTIVNGAPASSKRVEKKDGSFIISIDARGGFKEFAMPHTLLNYTGDGQMIAPRGSMTDVRRGMAEFGQGWEVMLRIPKKHQGPLKVHLYMLQDRCDFDIEVKGHQTDEVVKFKVTYSEVGAIPGVVKIPLEIPQPIPGGFYSIKVLASSEDLAKKFAMALNAIYIGL